MISCNVVIPQLLWWKRNRIQPKPLFAISLVILYGMWMERT